MMNASDRQALPLPSFDDAPQDALDDFAPRGTSTPAQTQDTQRSIDSHSRFPSREASAEGQLNLKGPKDILDRFRAMCKDDRRTYYDMLRILMDSYEGKGRP